MNEAMQNWGPLILACACAACMLAYWIVQTRRHEALLRRVPIRVHVNGIRGKSTIVRYIAGALREGGIRTVAKTTGSATRLIRPDGREETIARTGAPTIIEQIDILRRAIDPQTQAFVIECMALEPEYQRVSERRMIRATDGIIANVRRDHIGQLGYRLTDIASSLSNTAPRAAPLFTAEGRAELRAVLSEAVAARDGHLVAVAAGDVSDAEMAGFDPLSFPENVALALAVAERHGVPRDVALRGMRKARPDPGASKLFHHRVEDRDLYWIDLFGVNDVESAQANLDRVAGWAEGRGELILVLNNRADREDRTLEFAEMVAGAETADRVFLAGENLDTLRDAVRKAGLKNARLLKLPKDPTPRDILDQVTDGGSAVLVGLANIHTADATRLRATLEDDDHVWSGEAEAPLRSAA
ncbi:poly-gamma-glutamate synthase PgsB [Jannaschia ovalis]|uniref:Poly-gamma-glutamate synthase PgsB n=1 Tax=Jannaschia ovalis TaxID=3038773 RepID=A0ABY8LCU2_9RHOB|nr:poly-gamma-glutamate synthase PgsB [Jannaschia sp. GRR-S6-38]WGH77984.1 poly-gamma-glutamate synthase PgsB [Jannaschia sp. GRR-S6-38]